MDYTDFSADWPATKEERIRMGMNSDLQSWSESKKKKEYGLAKDRALKILVEREKAREEESEKNHPARVHDRGYLWVREEPTISFWKAVLYRGRDLLQKARALL